MAHKHVSEVIGRAAIDSNFRDLLFNDPETALTEYDLTDDEKDALLKLDKESLEVLSKKIDSRITKGFTLIGG